MLLKYSQLQKRNKVVGSGKPQRSTGKVKTVGKGKGHRKGIRGLANKRIKTVAPRRDEAYSHPVDPCDNSNDSGLGFDHHLEFQLPRTAQTTFIEQECIWPDGEAKRQKFDVKLESDNANDNFTFPHAPKVVLPSPSPAPHSRVQTSSSGKCLKRGSQVHQGQSVGLSKDGKIQLVILSQPEMQHRARYQTEGSRGAVKDRTGNGFPVVKLIGYDKPAILEVYIGTDQGREAPHMFYQACRVAGKNSTPCVEKIVDGTVLIEIEFDPSKDMTVTCDCVGILKERNVDVEHRFPDESTTRSKKKSTRCRMVFRTVITNSDHTHETLQVTSQPIICTQPPGVPEICKKSLVSCQATGGLELFILGKNFLKDTKVIFSEGDVNDENYWEDAVQPDKEFLQQSHLVCTIPPYKIEDIKESVVVKLSIVSSGRSSEAHTFIYTPVGTPPLQALPHESIIATRATIAHCVNSPPVTYPTRNLLLGIPLIQLGSHPSLPPSSFIPAEVCKLGTEEAGAHPAILMPPPTTTALPPTRRSSQSLGSVMEDRVELKREAESPTTESVNPDLMSSQTPSMATIRQFVSSTPLPALSVENYLSKIESNPSIPSNQIPFIPPKSFEESTISSRDELVTTLEEQIGVSMSNEVQAASKLDAFVKSSVESQLSPGQEVQQNLQRSGGEMILTSIGLTQRNSPLGLNAHETITSAISAQPLIQGESKAISPAQNNLCELLSPSQPMPSQMLDRNLVGEAPPSLLINSSFSPGKNIAVNSSDNLSMNQLSGPSTFSDIPVSSSSDSSNLLMKVVDSLNQSQFSSPMAVHSLQNTSQTSPALMSPSFVSHEQVEEPMISSADYITTESLTVSEREVIKTEPSSVTNQAHFSTSILPISFSKHGTHLIPSKCAHNMNMVASSSSNSALMVNGNCEVGTNTGGLVISNHFPVSVINSSPLAISSMDSVKRLSSDMNSTFSNPMVYSSAQKLPVVSSEPTNLRPSVIGGVHQIPIDSKSDQFMTNSFQGVSNNEPMSSPSQSSLLVEANILGGGGVSRKSDDNLSLIEDHKGITNLPLIEGNNNDDLCPSKYHQGISMVNSFSAAESSQLQNVFLNASSTSCPVTTLPSSSAPSTTPSTSSSKNAGVAENKSDPLPTAIAAPVKKCEEGMPFTHELTQMSDHDLLSYINPSCFDTV